MQAVPPPGLNRLAHPILDQKILPGLEVLIAHFVSEIPAALFDGSAPNGEYPPEKREERKQIAKARFFAQMRQRGLGEALKE